MHSFLPTVTALLFLKKIWPISTNRAKLPQGCKTTTRRQLTLNHHGGRSNNSLQNYDFGDATLEMKVYLQIMSIEKTI